jgi:hypothetical protein
MEGVAPQQARPIEAKAKQRALVFAIMRAVAVATLIMAFGLYACVERPAPPQPQAIRPRIKPSPPPVPVTPPAPALGADWRDWPLTPGNWTYRQDGRGAIALYGADGGNAVFMARCDRGAGGVFLSHAGAFSEGETGRMTVRTSSGAATFEVANTGSNPPFVAAKVSPRDPQLDNIAFSRGRFVVSVKGTPDLVIPSWPEFARVIEDCRG